MKVFLLLLFFFPLTTSAFTNTFYSGPFGVHPGTLQTDSTMEFTLYCDEFLSLVDEISVYGGFSGNAGNATLEINGDAYSVPVGITTGNLVRTISLSTTTYPCTDGQISLKYYRSGTTVGLAYTSFANGKPSSLTAGIKNQVFCTANCGSFGTNDALAFYPKFGYNIEIASPSSGGSSSDMSTSTVQMLVDPIVFSLGVLIFFFTLFGWFFLIKRNRK